MGAGGICELENRAIVIAQFAQYRENRMGWGGGMNRASVIYGLTAKNLTLYCLNPSRRGEREQAEKSLE